MAAATTAATAATTAAIVSSSWSSVTESVSVVPHLAAHLAELQDAWTHDATAHTQQLLTRIEAEATRQGTTLLALRPPHAVAYYPCGYADCVPCQLRTIYTESLTNLRTEVTATLARVLRVPITVLTEANLGVETGAQ